MITDIIEEEVEKFVSEINADDKDKAEIYFREGMITAYTVIFENMIRQGVNVNLLQDGV